LILFGPALFLSVAVFRPLLQSIFFFARRRPPSPASFSCRRSPPNCRPTVAVVRRTHTFVPPQFVSLFRPERDPPLRLLTLCNFGRPFSLFRPWILIICRVRHAVDCSFWVLLRPGHLCFFISLFWSWLVSLPEFKNPTFPMFSPVEVPPPVFLRFASGVIVDSVPCSFRFAALNTTPRFITAISRRCPPARPDQLHPPKPQSSSS